MICLMLNKYFLTITGLKKSENSHYAKHVKSQFSKFRDGTITSMCQPTPVLFGWVKFS